MKITHIQAENFLGIRSARIETDLSAIHLFAGPNGAGKSSLSEAVRMALCGEAVRVSLKKEYGALVHDGERSGFITVSLDNVPNMAGAVEASMSLPSGKTSPHALYVPPAALPYVLDAQRFAHMPENDRRAFLFGLMGVRTDVPAVSAKLIGRGFDKARVEKVAPLLRSGFDAACKQAKAYATEAKGAWRTITGETWGSEKGKTWRASLPAFDAAHMPKLTTELKHCDAALETWQQTIGNLQAVEQRRAALQAKLPGLREAAAGAERIRKKDAADRAELAKMEEQLANARAAAGGGPRVGLVHVLAAAIYRVLPAWPNQEQDEAGWTQMREALSAYEAEHGRVDIPSGDPESRARLPALEHAHGIASRAVANNARDLEAAQRAQAEVDAATTELAEPFDAAALADARAQAEKLKATRAEIVTKLDLQKSLKAQAEGAERKTDDAAVAHADVMAWDGIGDALAPDGIPAELLSDALGPINDRLMRSALDAEWPRVGIGSDMSITVGDAARPYALLSESEQWRCDAMIAEAVSHLSGLKLLVLDRFDVLDATGRSDLLAWLDVLASEGEIDTALVFGTLKALPAGLPETMSGHWIEAGNVNTPQEAMAA